MSTNLEDYNFSLPTNLIATKPISPRDEAKMLVYNRAKDTITHSKFKHILDFVPQDTCFFFNNTRVIKARIFGSKTSGAKIELLVNKPMLDNQHMVYIKGKVRVGDKLIFTNNLIANIIKVNEDGSRIVEFYQGANIINFDLLIKILDNIGTMPIPPYMKREANAEDESDYQSIYASNDGSVASPTASLHFSQELHNKILKNHHIQYITLHIGSGTFKPIDSPNIKEHNMHLEYYDINESSKKTIDSKQKILAVGTSASRAIESYIRTNKTKDDTDLFLHLENKAKRIDYLVTNFHFPKSSLLVLVSSFIGLDKTLEIYKEAIKKEYRFYSYGDGMLII